MTSSNQVGNRVAAILTLKAVAAKEVQTKNEDYFQSKQQISYALGYFKTYR